MDSTITPDVVLGYTDSTDTFLCPLSANTYKVQFVKFKIRDIESGATLFQVDNDPLPEEEFKSLHDVTNEVNYRTVRYKFGETFFKLKTVGTTVDFVIGS